MPPTKESEIVDLIHDGNFHEALRRVREFEGDFVERDNPAHAICYGYGRTLTIATHPAPRFATLIECLAKLDANDYARNPDSDWNLLQVAHEAGDVDMVRFLLMMGWPMGGKRGKHFVANGRQYVQNVETNGPSWIYAGHMYWRDGKYLRDLRRAQKSIERARKEDVQLAKTASRRKRRDRS